MFPIDRIGFGSQMREKRMSATRPAFVPERGNINRRDDDS
jgi:hypothetical protein